MQNLCHNCKKPTTRACECHHCGQNYPHNKKKAAFAEQEKRWVADLLDKENVRCKKCGYHAPYRTWQKNHYGERCLSGTKVFRCPNCDNNFEFAIIKHSFKIEKLRSAGGFLLLVLLSMAIMVLVALSKFLDYNNLITIGVPIIMVIVGAISIFRLCTRFKVWISGSTYFEWW